MLAQQEIPRVFEKEVKQEFVREQVLFHLSVGALMAHLLTYNFVQSKYLA